MRSDHSQPFDQPFDREADDNTSEFWGATRAWEPRPASGVDADGDAGLWSERTGSIGAIKHNLSGFRNRRSESRDRTRSHGIQRPTPVETDPTAPGRQTSRQQTSREATLGELAAGWPDDDDDWGIPTQQLATTTNRQPRQPRQSARPQPTEHNDDDFDDEIIPLSPVAPLARRLGLGAVDPLLARSSAIVAIGVLLVPVALALRSGKGDSLVSAEAVGTGATAGLANGAPISDMATTTPATVAATTTSQSSQTAPVQAASGSVAQPETVASPTTLAAVADVAQSNLPATTIAVEPATVTAEAERVEPVCALTYTAGPGDSWYRIAEEAGITPGELTQTNLASLDTTIFPGDEICLPEGATMPSPPTTVPATTQAPATTETPTTTVANTQAPTTSKPPAASATTAQVQQLIRDIWPDELEEKALQIAWRESSYKATAFNGTCCYGVFQLHWTSHRSWLDDFGILTSSDLFDARKNITAAYALYQRSGGWGPWGG